MSQTRAQAQLRFFEAMSRITQLEILAEQLQKLANSYGKEEDRGIPAVREEEAPYRERFENDPSMVLREQAAELRAVASAWHREARSAYAQSRQEA